MASDQEGAEEEQGMVDATQLLWLQQQLAEMPIEDGWNDPSDGVLAELYQVVEDGDLERTKELLSQLEPSHINTVGPEEDTLLHIACLYGHEPCVEVLLEHGANVDVRDEDEGTVLHDAGASGDVGIVKLILAAGPTLVSAVDNDGDTALHNAARGGHEAVVQYLLAHGADPTLKNKAGETPRKCCGPDVETTLADILVAAEARCTTSAPVETA